MKSIAGIFLLLFFTACSTINHHKIGEPFSGAGHVGTYEAPLLSSNIHDYPSWIMVYASLVYIPIYTGIDAVGSFTADALIFPIDYLYMDTYHEHKEYEHALHDRKAYDFTIRHYSAGDYKEEYPLHTAVILADLNKTRLLLEQGYDIDTPDRFRHTPIEYALKMQNGPLIKSLKERGADTHMLFIDWIDQEIPLQTLKSIMPEHLDDAIYADLPLMNKAVSARRADIVRYFIARGDVGLNTPYPSIRTALHTASYNETPMHTVVRENDTEIAGLLIAAGAYINATTDKSSGNYLEGDTPYSLARFDTQRSAMLTLLKAHDAQRYEMDYLQKRHLKALKRLQAYPLTSTPLQRIHNGTITLDRGAHRMWEHQIDLSKPRKWKENNLYCESLRLGGFDDWYMPFEDDIERLADHMEYKEHFDTSLQKPIALNALEVADDGHVTSMRRYDQENDKIDDTHFYSREFPFFTSVTRCTRIAL